MRLKHAPDATVMYSNGFSMHRIRPARPQELGADWHGLAWVGRGEERATENGSLFSMG